jgi:hypothetical protein
VRELTEGSGTDMDRQRRPARQDSGAALTLTQSVGVSHRQCRSRGRRLFHVRFAFDEPATGRALCHRWMFRPAGCARRVDERGHAVDV